MFSVRDWILIVIAIIFIVGGVYLDLIVPEYFGTVTNMVIDGTGSSGEIWLNGLWMLLFSLGSMASAIVVAWIGAVVAASHAARVRRRIFGRVGEFSTAEMKKFSVASLITRSTNDVTQVQMFTVLAIQILVRAPIIAIWAIIKMLDVSAELSIVAAVAVVALVTLIAVLIVIVMPRFNKIQTLTDRLNQVSRENLTGLRVVRAYNASEYEQEKFECANTNLAKTNLVVNRAFGIFWPFMMLLLSGLSVAIYWVGSWMFTTGRETDPEFFGAMTEFSNYATQVIFAFMMLIMVLALLPRSLVSGKRIMEVLNTNPSVAANEDSTFCGNLKSNDITFENVSFRYPGAEESVLSSVNLKIPAGKTVAFIGGTGSGKSTLVNLLPRIYDATDGRITIGDVCVRDMALSDLNDVVGYIPQTATIFNGTIRSNVAFGETGEREDGSERLVREVSDEDVEIALRTAQAWEFVSKLEKGIDSEVSQSGKNLSGGQKQRLAIARVMVRRPKIYIFDDTFSALDYNTDRKLRTALKKETKGATVLIVAQRIGTIKDADIIYVLDKGQIVGSGTHDQLMKNNEVYKEIALSQLSKEELA